MWLWGCKKGEAVTRALVSSLPLTGIVHSAILSLGCSFYGAIYGCLTLNMTYGHQASVLISFSHIWFLVRSCWKEALLGISKLRSLRICCRNFSLQPSALQKSRQMFLAWELRVCQHIYVLLTNLRQKSLCLLAVNPNEVKHNLFLGRHA